LLKNLRKKILFSIALAGIFYLGFTIFANYKDVLSAFEKFNWLLLLPLLLLSLVNYFVRFLKWDYFLSVIKIKLNKIDSLSIFLSGLVMSVTPGKMGELLKAYLTKEVTGVPISKSAPIVFVERITDFLALIIISISGVFIFKFGLEIILGVGIFLITLILIIANKKAALAILKLLEKNRFLDKHLQKFNNAYESSYQLLKFRPLIYMTMVSVISWLAECLGYYIILRNFGIENSFLWAAFSYSFATIAGAISMLPGGLGVTEGSLTFMLIKNGQAKEFAVATTFIVRVVTLWFAVIVGIFSLMFYQKRFGKILIDAASI
jgi:glycosyltransferase 2 family protein